MFLARLGYWLGPSCCAQQAAQVDSALMTRPPERDLSRRVWRNPFLFTMLTLGAISLASILIGQRERSDRLRFDQFLNKVDDGQVLTAEIFLPERRIRGTLKDGTRYETKFVGNSEGLVQQLAREGTQVHPNTPGQSVVRRILTNALPLVLVVGFLLILVFVALLMNQVRRRDTGAAA